MAQACCHLVLLHAGCMLMSRQRRKNIPCSGCDVGCVVCCMRPPSHMGACIKPRACSSKSSLPCGGAHVASPAAHVVVVVRLGVVLAARGARCDARVLAQHLAVRIVARLRHHPAARGPGPSFKYWVLGLTFCFQVARLRHHPAAGVLGPNVSALAHPPRDVLPRCAFQGATAQPQDSHVRMACVPDVLHHL